MMAHHDLPDLLRRIDRKLDIRRGMHLSIDDLETLVSSGAYAAMSEALTKQRESKCQGKPNDQTNRSIIAGTTR